MGKRFKNVWVSSEEKMQFPFIGFVFEDRGELEINRPFLDYRGKKQTWRIANINTISHFRREPVISKKVITIILILFSILSLLNFVMFMWGLTVSNIALSTGIEIASWITAFALPTVMALAWIVHLSSLGPLGTSRWIKVAYLDEKNQLQTVYFADASQVGWGGILGGTQKIYAAIQQEIAQAQIS